ncbi:fe(2+) transport protein 2-like, partial [Rutidosis leptorrhynchoides]|uniref:fe(2+) transport protein 2-like n=1 Tax=Rutidosis leptorrhynchoides TaxID=125765 RepID=UPI003A9A1184
WVTTCFTVTLPLLSRSVPALQPDTKLFVLVKAIASAVILATGYMHVLLDSFECLTSKYLPEKSCSKFPLTTFIVMLSVVLTLMIDSYAMSGYKKCCKPDQKLKISGHCHGDGSSGPEDTASQLRCYRVVAQVLELRIVVHSIVIGLSMGASNNLCTIKPLVAAVYFHQFFEGMGLSGCILQIIFPSNILFFNEVKIMSSDTFT